LNYGEVVWPLSTASERRYHSIALGIIVFLMGSATLLLPVAIMAKPLSRTTARHRRRFGRYTSTFSESFVTHRGQGGASEARMKCAALSRHRMH